VILGESGSLQHIGVIATRRIAAPAASCPVRSWWRERRRRGWMSKVACSTPTG